MNPSKQLLEDAAENGSAQVSILKLSHLSRLSKAGFVSPPDIKLWIFCISGKCVNHYIMEPSKWGTKYHKASWNCWFFLFSPEMFWHVDLKQPKGEQRWGLVSEPVLCETSQWTVTCLLHKCTSPLSSISDTPKHISFLLVTSAAAACNYLHMWITFWSQTTTRGEKDSIITWRRSQHGTTYLSAVWNRIPNNRAVGISSKNRKT